MSWGERSCAGGKNCNPTISTCNVDCEFYEWDGKTTPDSGPHMEIPHELKQYEPKQKGVLTKNQAKRLRRKRK